MELDEIVFHMEFALHLQIHVHKYVSNKWQLTSSSNTYHSERTFLW